MVFSLCDIYGVYVTLQWGEGIHTQLPGVRFNLLHAWFEFKSFISNLWLDIVQMVLAVTVEHISDEKCHMANSQFLSFHLQTIKTKFAISSWESKDFHNKNHTMDNNTNSYWLPKKCFVHCVENCSIFLKYVVSILNKFTFSWSLSCGPIMNRIML